jgi:hypothetical protein
MNRALPAVLLMNLVLLSGCAAALVYDRDRPASQCSDPKQRCPQSAVPAGYSQMPFQALAVSAEHSGRADKT